MADIREGPPKPKNQLGELQDRMNEQITLLDGDDDTPPLPPDLDEIYRKILKPEMPSHTHLH